MSKKLRNVLLIIGLVLVVAVGGFVIWGSTPLPPMAEAKAALVPDSQVSVEKGRWIVFQPVETQADTGLIIYPGGRVDARAYAPAARAIAEKGYLVVIVPMPLNLAVFKPGAAADVIAAYPEIEHWVVGGHSLGGAMAANFAKNHPEAVDGLALWAAYPAKSDDLSQSDLGVLSIYGSRDGLATGEKIDASRALLPGSTRWVAIEGGNHSQMGWYGDQPGDNTASISRQDQQSQIVEAIAALLESMQ